MDRFRLQKALEQGVDQGVFPGGVLLVARGGGDPALVTAGTLDRGPGSPGASAATVYDLASLTKILSTTILTMVFLDRGLLDLDDPLSRLWPGRVPEDKQGITLRRLLAHDSGFPAWRPFYESLVLLPESERRSAAAEAILREPLEARPGARAVYSDLNFLLLGFILEKLGGRRQERLFEDLVAGPLGLTSTGYRALDRPRGPNRGLAPTEDVPRRGGVILGEVHDDNAWSLAGVAGHAGLFAPAVEIWRIFAELRRAFRGETNCLGLVPGTVRVFWTRDGTAPGSTRALGFDMPSAVDSSAGRLFSRLGVGHLGFTGTSLWHDPERDLTVILLTNRVHPTAANQSIKTFRPYMHDEVVKAVFPARGEPPFPPPGLGLVG
ncbi:MAG: serine hydrolase [Pseudomonadota bacterium]